MASKIQNGQSGNDNSTINIMELDIRIQFPEKGTSSSSDHQIEKLWPTNSSTNNNSNKEILIILLGWAGAEHKYLSKYSDYYLQRGCIVLSFITPLRYHFVEPGKLPIVAKRILKHVTDLQLESHPTYFHIFSNGGSFTYSYILQSLSNPKNTVKLDIRGTIFDSAPSPRRLQTSYRAMLSIFSNLKIFKYIVTLSVISLLIFLVFWYHLKCAFNFCVYGDSLESLNAYENEVAPLTNWMGRIAKMRNHNFLFLYSDADDLVPADKVEQFASFVKDRGNKVRTMKFEGSEHVMHYRRYPKEYSEEITNFIRSTMSEKDEKTVLYDE